MIVISVPLLVLITNIFGKYKPDGKSIPEMSFRHGERSAVFHWEFDDCGFCDIADELERLKRT